MGLLRLLLAVSVVLAHAPIGPFRMVPGDLAVECFFLISGFYMALILGSKYPLNREGIRRFYINRYLRLAPTYWVLIFICLLVAWRSGSTYNLAVHDYLMVLSGLHPFEVFWILFSNLFMFGQDILMFVQALPDGLEWIGNPSSHAAPGYLFVLIPPAWSLGVELWFYVLAPLLARQKIKILIFIGIASLGIRILLAANGFAEDPWRYRFFPSELMFFVIGMILFRLTSMSKKQWPPTVGIASLSAIIVLIFLYPYLPMEPEVKRWGFLFAFAVVLPFVFSLTKISLWDRRIGELSYPLYLCHTVLQQFVRVEFQLPELETGAIVLFGGLAIAILLDRLIERPLDRWRQKMVAQPRVIKAS